MFFGFLNVVITAGSLLLLLLLLSVLNVVFSVICSSKIFAVAARAGVSTVRAALRGPQRLVMRPDVFESGFEIVRTDHKKHPKAELDGIRTRHEPL